MEKEEAREILKIIESVYPNFVRGDADVTRLRIKIWGEQLMSWDYEQTKANLMKYIEESPYVPSIADIKPRVQETYSMKERLKEIYGDVND